MKCSIAQIRPIKGNISANIEAHKNFIDLALSSQADAIFFPELSLTAYEPALAKELATDQEDGRLDIFQTISDQNKLLIGLGLPTRTDTKIRISMVLFEPNRPRQTYSKQLLHSDELPYFENGEKQLILTKNQMRMAPAICYESLQASHAENAFQLGTDLYVASVAKSAKGIEKAYSHYPAIAKKYSMAVLMSNSLGFCDNFLSVGKSTVWTKDGKLGGQLDDQQEGILIYDTETEEILERTLKSSY